MSNKIAFWSCENLPDPGKAAQYILAHAPSIVIFHGDGGYFNGGQTAYGYTTAAAIETTTEAQYLDKYEQFAAKPMMAAILASGSERIYQWDDHEFPGDNWCNDIGAFSGILGFTTQAQINSTWVKALNAYITTLSTHWDNPLPNAAGNTEIPAGALQEAQNPPTTAYPILYFYRDYVMAGRTLRIIYTDCISYRGPRTADGEFLGAQQEAWLQATLISSTADWILISSTKKLFQATPPDLDNNDTYGQWPTARNRVLSMIQATGKKVICFSGDRHTPHVMESRVASGGLADIIDICVCPAGVDLNGVTGVPNMIWKTFRQCFGLFTVSFDRLRIDVRDAITDSILWGAEFAPGSNTPIYNSDVETFRIA